jgi:hypothetical protein
MAFDWGSFFSSGVEELGAVAKAKDTTVAAEAKANAEEFAGKTEAYEDEITKNKRMLRQETDAIRGLGIKDVGKIRTIMKTYGNADVVKQIGEDFKNYQSRALIKGEKPQYTTLADYIKGRISGAGTTMLSDEAAEQASDEAAVAGDELDIQQAERKAKAQGVSLAEYLENQARRMSDRPAFNIDARAARLVEESKMGLFGKTLTMDEAKQQILAGKTMEGAGIGGEVKDLGETGFALQREGGLSAEEIIKLKALQEKADPKINQGTLLTREKSILKGIDGGKYIVSNDGGVTTSIIQTPESKKAMLGELNRIISQEFKDMDKESQKIIMALKEKYEQPSTKEKQKGVTINDVIQSKKKSGKTNQQIAQELLDKGKAKTLEEALKIVEGV